jgi:general secretion pathway protein K
VRLPIRHQLLPPRGTRQRGAALLVVITSVAILTAVCVDLAYNTRVSLQSAANARDELRAYYLAKSAVSMSRLVLYFQQRLDGAGAAGAPQLAALGAPRLAMRLWELVPVDSSAVSLFLGGSGSAGPSRVGAGDPAPAVRLASSQEDASAAAAGPAEGTRRAFGDVEGSFHATIDDEERKVNLRQFDGVSFRAAAQVARLADLVKDPKWDFIFDEDDANGMRVARKDLFAAIKDWEDENETNSGFTGLVDKPFENGFGDENAFYDRMPDRYKAKNAAFDSLDELYMVAGINDAFMAAFGDKLTIYPDLDATINVNTDDPAQLLVNALLMSDPAGVPQPALADPAFLQKLQAALALTKPMPFMAITPQQFAGVLQALGLKINSLYLQAGNTDQRNAFGDRSSTFHIAAVGVAGDVTKHIDAVVTFDRRAEGLAQDAGRLLHWHEE